MGHFRLPLAFSAPFPDEEIVRYITYDCRPIDRRLEAIRPTIVARIASGLRERMKASFYFAFGGLGLAGTCFPDSTDWVVLHADQKNDPKTSLDCMRFAGMRPGHPSGSLPIHPEGVYRHRLGMHLYFRIPTTARRFNMNRSLCFVWGIRFVRRVGS